MRVFLATVLLVVTTALNLAVGTAAEAAEYYGYAYVDEGVTAYFCSEPDARTSLFAIPETYCVAVVSDYNDEWYYVKYAEDDGVYISLYGYVLKRCLTPTDQILENVYLHMTVKLTFSADKVNGMAALPDIEVTAAFYGSYEMGGTACSYLYCNGHFGYYPQTYAYERNPIPTAPAFSEETPAADNSTLIAAVAITAIAVAAVAILYFSGKRKPSREDEQE